MSSNQGYPPDVDKSPKIRTLREYLRIRREEPEKYIGLNFSFGLDWLLANEKILERHDLQLQDIARSLDGDSEAVSRICLDLMDRVLQRKDLEKSGATHVVSSKQGISDALVNYLIWIMLESLVKNEIHSLPTDLIVLIGYQIGTFEGTKFDANIEHDGKRFAILFLAIECLMNNQTPTMRKLASECGLNVSTVSRMFPENSLQREAEELLPIVRHLGQFSADLAKKNR